MAVFAGSLSRLLAGVVIARMLGPDLNGRYAFLLWLVETAVLIFNAGMPTAVNRFLSLQLGQSDSAAARNVLLFSLTICAVLSLASAGVVFVVVRDWFLTVDESPLATALALLVALQLVSGLAQSMLMGLHQFRVYALAIVIVSFVLLGAQTIGAWKWGLAGAIHGALISQLFAVVMLLLAVARSSVWHTTSKIKLWPDPAFLFFARDAWLASLISAVVWGRAELFLLERFSTTQQVGYFAAGLVFSSLVVQAVNLLSGAFLPHMSRLVGTNNIVRLSADYRRLTVLIALLTFPTVCGSIALMTELIILVFGPAYVGATAAAQWLMAAGLLSFASVGSSVIYSQGDAWIIRNWSLIAAVLLTTLCAWVAPLYGAEGVAGVRFSVQGLMIAIGSYLLIRRYDMPFPANTMLKILIAALICGSSAWAAMQLVGGDSIGLIFGIMAGSAAYVVALRAFGAISANDAIMIGSMIERLPPSVGKPCNRLLAWIAST